VRIAVIADVHGNRWALEAVLGDVDRRGVDVVVDLGDSVYGPLDPRGTAEALIARGVPSVRGNEDRVVLEPPGQSDSPTLRYTRSCLSAEQRRWLGDLPMTASVLRELFCCHGTPERDDEYLLEAVSEGGVRLRSADELAARLAGVREAVVLCGHSHLPRLTAIPEGALIVNPGSVGLPAYTDDVPAPHAMEAGSPHARYALIERIEAGWRVEHVALPYDWTAAAQAAAVNGRSDWAEWLRTGRAPLPGRGGA
jgi:putative phosphoesterase